MSPRGQKHPQGLHLQAHCVEQELEQEMFIKLDDFDDSIKEKKDADFSTNYWSSYLCL